MTNYPIGDFLIRIKNAALGNIREVSVEQSKQKVALAKTLKKAGFLEDISVKDNVLTVKLAVRRKTVVLTDLKLISKPGLRVYMGVKDLENKKGPSKYIVSTPKGIMTSSEAIKIGMGGEVITEVL